MVYFLPVSGFGESVRCGRNKYLFSYLNRTITVLELMQGNGEKRESTDDYSS
jgi:hypothetical protein